MEHTWQEPHSPLTTVAGRAWVSHALLRGLHLTHSLESLLFLHLMEEQEEREGGPPWG